MEAYLQVSPLVMPADVVGLAHVAVDRNSQQCSGVILDIEPVPYLRAVAVNGQRLAVQGVEDHVWNQFFWKMIGAVVVGAVGDHYRQAVGSVPGSHQVIGTGLAGGIGRRRGIGGIFTK